MILVGTLSLLHQLVFRTAWCKHAIKETTPGCKRKEKNTLNGSNFKSCSCPKGLLFTLRCEAAKTDRCLFVVFFSLSNKEQTV